MRLESNCQMKSTFGMVGSYPASRQGRMPPGHVPDVNPPML